MIGDPVGFQNLLRRASGEWHSHEWNVVRVLSPFVLLPSGIYDVKQLGAVGTQARFDERPVATNKHVWHRLIECLLVDVEGSGPVGHEDDFFTIRGPALEH